jgi:hypothetical protein
MTSSKKSTFKLTEETKTAAKGGATKTQLPEGVTEEPRNEEEMHMKYIKDSPLLVDVYLSVSNDNGCLLGDEKLEETVKSFIKEFKDKEIHELDKPAVVLSQLRSLVNIYYERLKRAGYITDGIQTKSGIRRGALLNIEKRLVRKDGKDWVAHYIDTYCKRSLRSAQDYMALARTPNIIRYAFIGKERCMECIRAIKTLKIESDDPVGLFLEKYHIAFDPENSQDEETMTDLKLGIDSAIALTRIEKEEQQVGIELQIDPDYIKKLIENGIAINNAFIDDLFIIKGEDHDVIEHIKSLIGEDGNEDSLLSHIKKLNAFPRHITGLKNTIDSINEHGELVNRIEQDQINDLEQFITELKNLVQNGAVTG